MRSVNALDPKRAIVFPARFNANARWRMPARPPLTSSVTLFLSSGNRRRNGDSAAIGERLLLGLEIVTLESGAVTLCREGTIFHGMVDDGDSRLFGGKSFGPTKELASGN